MIIVSGIDPDYCNDRTQDHLWLLVGGDESCDAGTSYYLGHDRDIEGDDLASAEVIRVSQQYGLDRDRALELLEDYRRWIKQSSTQL